MAENTKSDEFLSKLAIIADASQTLLKGKVTIIFELPLEEFETTLATFNTGKDNEAEQFKVDISGTDFIFILDKL
jgi:hypothetical protein